MTRITPYHILHLTLFCASLIFFACSEENIDTRHNATIQLSITDVSQSTDTRATPNQLEKPIQDAFRLNIVGLELQENVYNGAFASSVGPFRPGTYSIDIECGENTLALDAPYYVGHATAKIYAGFQNQVNIEACVANALISVKYADTRELDNTFSSYSIVVTQNSQSVELVGSEPTESVYLPASSTCSIAFRGIKASNGSVVEADLTNKLISLLPLNKGQHLKITLGLSDDLIDVIKADIQQVSIEQTIPVSWLPKPKTTASGFDVAGKLTLVETNDAPQLEVDYTTTLPCQDVELTLQFEDETYATINGTYLLSELNEDQYKTLSTMGLELPSLGQTNGTIGITRLAGFLRTNAGNTTQNTIGIRVKANDRWSSESPNNYTINVVKPEFTITALPENMWSKEFTVEEVQVNAGNAERIKADIVYQYSTDGITWHNCNEERCQKFSSHPSVKSYKVRACYRGAILSNTANVTLETPTQIPNSDMESWNTVKGENFRPSDGWFSAKKQSYLFYPYASGESDIWWATNNQRSQHGTIALGLGHPTCFAPCVSYNESIKHGGNCSALIYTSGHGGGYASTGEVIYPEGAIAGNLFIGSYQWSDKKETINTGHSFSVRPTECKFWYRYTPKNSDQFKVYVELRNGNTVVASGQYIPTAYSAADSEFKQASITLDYSSPTQKATSIYVQFLSTTKTSFTSDDFNKNQSISFPLMDNWNVHIGSMLYIDDISLVYDK